MRSRSGRPTMVVCVSFAPFILVDRTASRKGRAGKGLSKVRTLCKEKLMPFQISKFSQNSTLTQSQPHRLFSAPALRQLPTTALACLQLPFNVFIYPQLSSPLSATLSLPAPSKPFSKMVLLELGSSLRSTLSSLSSVNPSTAEITSTVDSVCSALVEADVDVSLVTTLRTSVESKIDAGAASSVNKKKLVQRSVQEALVELLEPERKAYVMDRRKKSNVILFVGLQGTMNNITPIYHHCTITVPPLEYYIYIYFYIQYNTPLTHHFHTHNNTHRRR